jgi:hypothetical protein
MDFSNQIILLLARHVGLTCFARQFAEKGGRVVVHCNVC